VNVAKTSSKTVEYGVHCFCFSCGTGWAEFNQPSSCIQCNGVSGLATSHTVRDESTLFGFVSQMTDGGLMAIQQMKDPPFFTWYEIPLPSFFFTLDSMILSSKTHQVYNRDLTPLTSIKSYWGLGDD